MTKIRNVFRLTVAAFQALPLWNKATEPGRFICVRQFCGLGRGLPGRTNILVTLRGAKPMPKVIDFGVAKATQGQA